MSQVDDPHRRAAVKSEHLSPCGPPPGIRGRERHRLPDGGPFSVPQFWPDFGFRRGQVEQVRLAARARRRPCYDVPRPSVSTQRRERGCSFDSRFAAVTCRVHGVPGGQGVVGSNPAIPPNPSQPLGLGRLASSGAARRAMRVATGHESRHPGHASGVRIRRRPKVFHRLHDGRAPW